MMKQLRIVLLIFFIATASLFTYTLVKRRLSVDYYPPVISADEQVLNVSIAVSDEDLLQGMKAVDNLDGDVTDTQMVVSKSKFVSRGKIHVNYAAFDSNKNVGTYTRDVIYTDYVSPHFHLYAPLRYANGTTGNDYLANITAEDCIDGNITQQIKISTGNMTQVSSSVTVQKVNIQVTNSAGDSAVLELTASIEDYLHYSQQAPALKEYIAYVRCGERPDLRSYIVGVWAAGNIRSFSDARLSPTNVSIDAKALDCSTPGIYTVIYKLKNSSGEELGTADLIVIVED